MSVELVEDKLTILAKKHEPSIGLPRDFERANDEPQPTAAEETLWDTDSGLSYRR